MSFTFRPAKREAVGLLIGLAGPSGGGKTYSALRLAKGLAGGKRFAVIDTEARRALHYADQFDFDHVDFPPPFTPARYAEAIAAADEAGYTVILVDSASHEHAGEGGILDMQEAELKRMGGGDNVKMASWIKPKGEHKRMVQKLLQVRAHLILCFRAEAKIDIVKEGNKTVIVPKKTLTSVDGWIPICEKSLPFELTASFLVLPDAPGVPRPIKLQEQHRAFFAKDKPITEAAGVSLAQWAAGGVAVPPAQAPATSPALQTYTGVYEHTVTRKEGALDVWDITVDGQTFMTADAALRDISKPLEKQRVTLTFKATAKGRLRLLTIAAAGVEKVKSELDADKIFEPAATHGGQ